MADMVEHLELAHVHEKMHRLQRELKAADERAGELRAALRTVECERQVALEDAAKLRGEKELLEQRVATLEDAAPVMLTVMALLAGEADVKGLREVGLWYEQQVEGHLRIWLDADNRRIAAVNHG